MILLAGVFYNGRSLKSKNKRIQVIIGPSIEEDIQIESTAVASTASHVSQEDRKTAHIAALFFKSPLVWTCGGVLISCIAVSFTCGLGLAVAIVGMMVFFPSGVPKSLLHEGILIDNLQRAFRTKYELLDSPYYNKIFPGMYLGALPASNFHHDRELIDDHGTKAVLSVVEDYELNEETFFFSPVKPSDWEKQGVMVKQIAVVDRKSLSIKELHEAADFIKENENNIYIHCRAGRARSVMALIAYLIKYKGMTYKAAEAFAKEKRPAMDLQEWQKERLKEFEAKLHQGRVL